MHNKLFYDEQLMVIYKITNTVNGKIYIGQSIRDVNIRFNEHLNDKTSNDYFHLAIRKYIQEYGKDVFTLEVIDTATSIEELNVKEIYWISHFRTFVGFSDCNGYNSSRGGTDNPMFNETIKEKHNTRMRSAEVRAKISNTMKQKIANKELFTEMHRQNISKAMRGNQHFKGHKRTPEAIQTTAKSLHKKVYCIDESNIIIRRFDSVVDACEWWYPEYVKSKKCKRPKNLSDVIKLSSKENKFILGLKWIYE